MHTNTFPALLSAEDAVAQDTATLAAETAAADAKYWQNVAVVLRVIERAGYTTMAERLLDCESDSNAEVCHAAVARQVIADLPRGRVTCGADVDHLIDVAVKGIVKARNNPTSRRRMANLLTHGSPEGPAT
jgi:hypothetical protein